MNLAFGCVWNETVVGGLAVAGPRLRQIGAKHGFASMRSRRVGLKGVLEVPEKEFNTVIQATTGHYDYRQRVDDSTLWNDGGSCQGVDSGSLLL